MALRIRRGPLDLGIETGKLDHLIYEAVEIARRWNPHFSKVELHRPIERIILPFKSTVPQLVPCLLDLPSAADMVLCNLDTNMPVSGPQNEVGALCRFNVIVRKRDVAGREIRLELFKFGLFLDHQGWPVWDSGRGTLTLITGQSPAKFR